MKRTVLVVDDSGDDVMLLKQAHRRAQVSFDLQFACDGAQAIERLAQSIAVAAVRPDVVLLDLKMPRKTGFEVLAWIRAQPDLKGLTVIVLTSSNNSVDIENAYRAGANDYVVKPLELDDLIHIMKSVERHLERGEPVQMLMGENYRARKT